MLFLLKLQTGALGSMTVHMLWFMQLSNKTFNVESSEGQKLHSLHTACNERKETEEKRIRKEC